MIQRWGACGPGVFCLHCSLGRGRAWAGFAKHLTGWQVLAPDLLGHGAAPDPDPAQDYPDAAFAALLGQVPAYAVPVIGHSFGATLALRLAIERPQQTSCLVLYEPVLFAAAGQAPGRQALAKDDIGPFLAAGDREGALARFVHVWGARPVAEMKPDLRAYMRDRVHLVAAAGPALNDDRAGLLPRLCEVSVPVLLVEGEESPPVIPEIMASLAASLPEARRVRLAGAGHMGPVSHAADFADLVGDFLAEVSAR